MIEYIQTAKPEELDELLQAVMKWYRELYPHWDLTVISINKRESREKKIDQIKTLLEKLK